MMNAKNFKEMNDVELDVVAGGTLTEVNQLADAFARKGGTFGKIAADIARLETVQSVLRQYTNCLILKKSQLQRS